MQKKDSACQDFSLTKINCSRKKVGTQSEGCVPAFFGGNSGKTDVAAVASAQKHGTSGSTVYTVQGNVSNQVYNTVKANVNVYTKNTSDKTQGWIFEPCDFIIRSAYNNSLVLSAEGTANMSNVKLAAYSEGNSKQLWSLVEKMNKNGLKFYKFWKNKRKYGKSVAK